MYCPKCGQQFYFLSQPCRLCEFNGNSQIVEQWNHIRWLLDEVDGWQWLYRRDREAIRQLYFDQLIELEIQLGLRLRPFTPEEAAAAWPKLNQLRLLLETIKGWLNQRWL